MNTYKAAQAKFDHNIENTIPALYNKYKVDVDFCMAESRRVAEMFQHGTKLNGENWRKI